MRFPTKAKNENLNQIKDEEVHKRKKDEEWQRKKQRVTGRLGKPDNAGHEILPGYIGADD